ncbi:MAG: Xaa-Pro peptidase family protein [Desulfobacterales bacterium]|nr:Xaa-Pro peptidase family protein [Desulfobacterales bacterium]
MDNQTFDDIIMPEKEISKRISNIRKKMAEKNIDVMIIFSGPGSLRYGQRGHVLYLSGYEPYFGDCMMILPGDDKYEPLLETDSADYFPENRTWIKNRVKTGDHIKAIKDYLSNTGFINDRIGIAGEYSVSPAFYLRMVEQLKPSEIVPASDILESERAVKSEFEVNCMKKAADIAAKGFEAAANFIKSGVKESDIVGEVERVCRKHGAQFFPHSTMVSSGNDEVHLSNWWNCGRRVLKDGDPVLMDFGTMYSGYCCDLCRPYVIGKASVKQKDVLNVLLDAHYAAAEAAKPGVMTSEVDAACNKVLTAAWGDQEWWGVGHGVGLEVHEWPFVGYHHIVDDEAYKDVPLEENMVISLEPTIYFSDTGDIQIEDQFLVTKAGGVRLNDIPHKIFEV